MDLGQGTFKSAMPFLRRRRGTRQTRACLAAGTGRALVAARCFTAAAITAAAATAVAAVLAVTAACQPSDVGP